MLGEAGLGKTTVLEEACRRSGDDVLVVTTRCDPMETSLAFGLMAQVVLAWAGATTCGRRRPSGSRTA